VPREAGCEVVFLGFGGWRGLMRANGAGEIGSAVIVDREGSEGK
jgi:hypothetical protein